MEVKMKKSIYLLMIITVLLLTGCSKGDQMTNYIPTAAPEESTDEAASTAKQEEINVTPTPKTIYVGQTTPMYVKLEEYDDFLNIRSAPSTDAEAVGFLVHTEKIDVIEIADGWASFLYKDAICYVNADYLVEEKPEYLDPPSPTPAPKSNQTQSTNSTDGPDI
jgi:uncharacterized protein YgiM (DUF1202 family)